MGITRIVLGFAPMNRFHIEGRAQNKGEPFLLTEVGQPIPREEAFHPYHQIFPVWGNRTQKRVGSSGQIFMQQFRPLLIQDTDVHRLGM